MTTADAAMSLYLNINQNVKGKPNENYAREFMELFCLGPTGPDGTPNYTQTDVAGLAQGVHRLALTTNDADDVTPNPDYGKITFTPSRFELAAKTFLGRRSPPSPARRKPTTNAGEPLGPAAINAAIDIVLAHRNHAQFLIRKLWAEFIASPIPQATLDSLVSAYTAQRLQAQAAAPRRSSTHPLIFESIDEPNLIKPPIVYMVGVLRQLGAPLKGNHAARRR